MNTPRYTPRPIENMLTEWTDTLKRIPGEGLKGKYAPVNVLGSLMYSPKILGQFLDWWVSCKLDMAFTVREQELVILRMGVHYDCNYVWKHHVPVAVEFGITQDEMDAVKLTPIPGLFSERENALLILTDEMVNSRNISDDYWQKYGRLFTPSEIIDLISLISQYVLFALTNNIFRVEIEGPLEGIQGIKSE